MIALALIAWTLNITGDMTPLEQANAIRRIIDRGACQTYHFNLYQLTACQDEATGKLVMWDTPWYMPEECVSKAEGEIKLGVWL